MQLTLHPYFDTEQVIESADNLIDMLNDGVKEKDAYDAENILIKGDYYILVAKRKDGQRIFNCIDKNGKIPEGFVANWRILPLVINDLKESKR